MNKEKEIIFEPILVGDNNVIDTPDVYGPLPEIDHDELIFPEFIDDVMCVYGPPPFIDEDIVEDESY